MSSFSRRLALVAAGVVPAATIAVTAWAAGAQTKVVESELLAEAPVPASAIPTATSGGRSRTRTKGVPPRVSSRPGASADWVTANSARTGIPVPALRAYANAAITTRTTHPSCRLGWVTLAGIGAVESDHGRHGGSQLGADGRTTLPILGPPLDGTHDTARILDPHGKPVRATGPMQFLPSTWASYGADGDGDGVASMHDIDDATLAAARYLCVGGRDLSTDDGWTAAVLTYNQSIDYAREVSATARSYSG